MKITQAMIAKRVGVARSTVSYALAEGNQSDLISAQVRDQIRKAALELGYAPNRNARSLVTGRSGTVAVIVEQVTGEGIWLWNQILHGAEEELLSCGYEILLCKISRTTSIASQAERLVRGGSADGVIVISWGKRTQDVAEARKSPFPLVFITVDGNSTSSHICHDVSPGYRQSTAHLEALGHRNLLWISPRLATTDASYRRATKLTGFAREYGLSVKQFHFSAVSKRDLSSRFSSLNMNLFKELEQTPFPPQTTAVLCWSDLVACVVYAVAARRGLSIPEDISVIGFDHIQPLGNIPSLTTISGAYKEMGMAGAKMTLNRLLYNEPIRHVSVPTYLVEQGSTAKPGTGRK